MALRAGYVDLLLPLSMTNHRVRIFDSLNCLSVVVPMRNSMGLIHICRGYRLYRDQLEKQLEPFCKIKLAFWYSEAKQDVEPNGMS